MSAGRLCINSFVFSTTLNLTVLTMYSTVYQIAFAMFSILKNRNTIRNEKPDKIHIKTSEISNTLCVNFDNGKLTAISTMFTTYAV